VTHTLDRQPFALDRSAEPPRRTWTPTLLAQLAVILAVLLSGVAGAAWRGHDDSKDVLSVVQAASTTAAAQKTMRATMEFRISGAGIDVTSRGDMVADVARQLMSGTFTAPGLGSVESRSIGGVSYTRLPGGRADAKGHHWVSYRALKAGAPVGGQDPMAFLKLVGDPQKVDNVGDEDVNGVTATHYRVHMDPAKLGAAVAKSGANITVPPGTFEQVKDATADLWIDDNNLPRRMSMAMGIQQVKASFRFDFFDYGKPIDVTAPDSSDVTELGSPQEIGKALSGIRTN
jgi:hypothetical protein